MKLVVSNTGNRILWLAVLLCTVYQSYRYPLQINSSGTSPTYSDTPLVLQAGKFVLALPLFALAAMGCLRKSALMRHWFIAFGVVFLSSFALLKSFGDPNGAYLESCFWMLFALVLAWSVDTVPARSIERYFRLLLIYALASTLIEVVLFLTIGRLPALAYEGSLSIRFGGFLDDPNGFAAILFLLVGWSYARLKGPLRILTLGSIVVTLLLTQSWTALGFLALLGIVSMSIALSKHPLFLALAICACILFTLFIASRPALSPGEVLVEIFTSKQGSINDHSFPWEHWASGWAGWVLLGDSAYNAFESWWGGALINFGVVWYLAFLGVTGALLVSLRNLLSRAGTEARPVYAGLVIFGYYFVFGSFNLPFPKIFPVNFIFFLFAFLAAFGRIQDGEFPSAHPVALPLQYLPKRAMNQ